MLRKSSITLLIGALFLSGCGHPETCTVKFLNWDESYLGADIVKYGQTAEYGGATPVGPNNQKFTYVFKGWDLPLDNITSDCQRIAQYDKENARYAVKFLNDDGTLLYTASVEYDQAATYVGDTPTKAQDNQYVYAFSGWSVPLEHIQTDTTAVAQYIKTDRLYQLTFKNWDGTTLSNQTAIWGATPSYTGVTPTRDEDEAGLYRFSGWSPALSAVYGDKTYTAQYEHVLNVYTVSYRDWDGSPLYQERVKWGESGTYHPTLKRASTVDHVYTFTGWDNPQGPIKQDTTLTAVYRENVREYNVIFRNTNGATLQTTSVAYGSKASYTFGTPTLSKDDFIYTFKGWDKDPTQTPILEDTTFTALYDKQTNYDAFKFTLLEDGTYSITGWLNWTDHYNFSSLHVPSTYQGVAVTMVAANGFTSSYALTSVVLPDSITSLGDSAFSSCDKLASITLSSKLTSIGPSCFSGCSQLAQIDLPSSLTTIGYAAFTRCSSLQKVVVPDGVTSLPTSVFSSCDALSEVSLGDSITSIGQYCFQYCSRLAKVKLPANLLSIGAFAFAYCPALVSIVFPAKLASIESSAFYECKALAIADLPSSLTSLERDAFNGCAALKSVIIPDSVTKVPSDCFHACLAVQKVTIGTSVTEIGLSAFDSCQALTSVSFLGSSLLSLGMYSFRNCPLLKEAIFPESLTTIYSEAFPGCEALSKVYIPLAVKSMGSNVFPSNYATKIYCAAASLPTSGWDSSWNNSCNNVYFYSENTPTSTGKYWHYDANHERVIW